MRTKFAVALAIVAVCATAAWAGWNDEFQITDREGRLSGLSLAHKVVIGDGGVVHLVWRVGSAGGGKDVYYKRYWPGDGWSEELKIGEDEGLVDPCPGIALDANGTDIHVVWRSSRTSGSRKNKISDATFYYWKCEVTGPGNGGWVGDPTDLCVNAVNGCTRWYPCIASGASGQVVVAWQEALAGVYSVVFREYVNGQWQDEEVIVGPTEDHLSYVTIAADGSGDVFVSHTQYPSSVFDGHVYATCRMDGEDWTDPENVTPGDDHFVRSAIEVSTLTGNPHLVCLSLGIEGVYTRHIYHTYRNDLGVWEDLVMVSDPDEMESYPRMFFTDDGAAHAVWDGYDSDEMAYEGIKYATCAYETGAWTDPVWLVSGADGTGLGNPDIAGDDGTLLAVWEGTVTAIVKKKTVTTTHVWGMYNTPGGDGGSAKPMAPQSYFELFPNPARAGRVAVRYTLPSPYPLPVGEGKGVREQSLTVTLVDISGRTVRSQELTAEGLTGTASVDVSGLSAGVYMARLVAGDVNVSQPLVIAQ
ncbi:T9SS type A sorting domain-containing protein [candidate division WOR-3 bacterium]|nr:T9SS type A sorting domain-containing protein [candidate division WOR-3 bacterium]